MLCALALALGIGFGLPLLVLIRSLPIAVLVLVVLVLVVLAPAALRLSLRGRAARIRPTEPAVVKRELLVRLEGTLAVRALDLQVSLCGAVLVLESGVGREHHIVQGELLGRRVALGPVVREDRERARRCPLEQLGAPLRERDHGQNDEGAAAA